MVKSKIIQKLLYRMNDRMESNCIILFGKKGSGKSFLALRFAYLLDPNFTLERVCFSPKQFFALIKKVPKGACIIYDEIGVGAGARDAQTRSNKNMSFIAQMIRSKCVTVLFTTISWGLVDAQVRNLMDFAIHVLGHKEGLTNFQFLAIEPRLNNPKPMMQHLVYNDENGRPVKYVDWVTKKAPDSLTEPYKVMREKYFDTIIDDAYKTEDTGDRYRDGERVKKLKKKIDLSMLVEQVRAAPEHYKNAKGKYDAALIQVGLDVGQTTSTRVVRYLKASTNEENARMTL